MLRKKATEGLISNLEKAIADAAQSIITSTEEFDALDGGIRALETSITKGIKHILRGEMSLRASLCVGKDLCHSSGQVLVLTKTSVGVLSRDEKRETCPHDSWC